MIDTENLTKRFGELTAVDGITLSVDEGEVFEFLGPNGAGKTTTVRMLSCLISKTSGTAWARTVEWVVAARKLKIQNSETGLRALVV